MRVDCPQCSVEYRVPDEHIRQPGRWLRCGRCDCSWFEFPPERLEGPADADASPATALVPVQPEQPSGHVPAPRPAANIAIDILDASFATIGKNKSSPKWFGRLRRRGR
ncbi:zinc-ribbon domain-containing protein [Croceicoccus gelatinilyticus]|uniref:zinc-ribbon domain-containing protein n=1 Tax=Croceicoccus gelatinilyticus TaxID=2835536 RepID=UPI001BCC3660|nr:zinc-ribbon domain-containing protein [Croceicoccus gelatinilyticus]